MKTLAIVPDRRVVRRKALQAKAIVCIVAIVASLIVIGAVAIETIIVEAGFITVEDRSIDTAARRSQYMPLDSNPVSAAWRKTVRN